MISPLFKKLIQLLIIGGAIVGILFLVRYAAEPATTKSTKKYVFFDLYKTLALPSTLKQGRESAGIGKLIKYISQVGGSKNIEARMFQFLCQLDCGGVCQASERPDSPNGLELPDLMIKWQKGSVSGEDARAQAYKLADEHPEFFTNNLEREVLLSLIDLTFTPEKFVGCLKPNKRLLKVARDIAECEDVEVCILSNLDEKTLAEIYKSPLLKNILTLFDAERIFISSDLCAMKPEGSCYSKVCERLGIAPDQCTLIDDQIRNVEGARKAGWKSLHYTGNEREIHRMLKNEIPQLRTVAA